MLSELHVPQSLIWSDQSESERRVFCRASPHSSRSERCVATATTNRRVVHHESIKYLRSPTASFSGRVQKQQASPRNARDYSSQSTKHEAVCFFYQVSGLFFLAHCAVAASIFSPSSLDARQVPIDTATSQSAVYAKKPFTQNQRRLKRTKRHRMCFRVASRPSLDTNHTLA